MGYALPFTLEIQWRNDIKNSNPEMFHVFSNNSKCAIYITSIFVISQHLSYHKIDLQPKVLRTLSHWTKRNNSFDLETITSSVWMNKSSETEKKEKQWQWLCSRKIVSVKRFCFHIEFPIENIYRCSMYLYLILAAALFIERIAKWILILSNNRTIKPYNVELERE